MRGYSNPPTEFGVRHLAIANGAFGRCQTTIFEGFEDGLFRGRDAGIFQDVVHPVGKAVGWKLDFVAGGLINLRGPTSGAVEPVADLL